MPRNHERSKKHTYDDSSDTDSSIDSQGNVRNLIDYDYSEDSDALFEMEGLFPNKKQLKQRKAATKAAKKIKKIIKKSTAETSSDSSAAATPPPPTKRRIRPTLIVESDESDESDESESDESVRHHKTPLKTLKKKSEIIAKTSDRKQKSKPIPISKPKKLKSKKYETESSSSEYDDDDDDDDDESNEYLDTEAEEASDSDEDDTEEDTSDEEENNKHRKNRRKTTVGGGGSFDIMLGDLFGMTSGGSDPNKPKKYNLKKEPQVVRRFVELVQKENEDEEDTIDNDISYFKSLTKDKQTNLLQVLEHKASPTEAQVPLKFKILEKIAIKPELNRIAMAKYNALCNLEPSSSEYYKCSHWINGFTNLPIGIYRDLPVRLEDGADKCHTFMQTVYQCMEKAIYGHVEPKLQILQFVSSWIANPTSNGNVLSVHGPPGVGKTSLIKDGVAKSLGRPFHFISLGGATDASYLDGHSYTYEGSTWGRIVEVLSQSKCMNPVIYFDELDKVSETPKGEEIMNLLIHLTDSSQNDRFQDKYFTGIDLDLSRCLFIFSHNNHEKVNPILRDRMYNIEVKGFSLKEKLLIAENYLLPYALRESGLHEKISIHKDILQYVIENYTGGEAGVRELKRCIQTIISKINLLRFYNNPKQIPFAISDFSLPFTIKKEHIELFLKKRSEIDPSVSHMYT